MEIILKIKVGVMGSAAEPDHGAAGDALRTKAAALASALAARDVILLTGGTTGLIYAVGKSAREEGVFHVGISPGSSETEHCNRYRLPTDACDMLIYTGFGLKGRNVVLVRSCDIVLFFAGGMGSLNEFTIAHDVGRIIGCLTGTGGVADEADYLLQKFSSRSDPHVFQDADPDTLLGACLAALHER